MLDTSDKSSTSYIGYWSKDAIVLQILRIQMLDTSDKSARCC